MSVSHCMHLALEVATKPRDQWAAEIAKIPTGCQHSDCGSPRSCRQRIADYLRVQYRAQARLPVLPGPQA